MAIFPTPGVSFPSFAWLKRILRRRCRILRRRRCSLLLDLANRPDDRLLRDIGLTREEALGVDGTFWRELERTRKPWSL